MASAKAEQLFFLSSSYLLTHLIPTMCPKSVKSPKLLPNIFNVGKRVWLTPDEYHLEHKIMTNVSVYVCVCVFSAQHCIKQKDSAKSTQKRNE